MADHARPKKANAEIVYERLLPRLSECQNLPRDIVLLGRTFRVTTDGVTQLDGSSLHVNAKSVLIWYVTTDGQAEPSFEFTPLGAFSHGIFTQSWERPAPSRERFAVVSERIGAALVTSEPFRETRMLFVLPRMPVLLAYSDADDEFPSALDVKFGRNALTFLPFETLAVLHGLILREFGGGW